MQRSRLALGKAVYEYNCYFCHGYRGDAKTLAAKTLNPPPRNFWRTPDLTPQRVEKAVRFGRPGTAMQSFAARLSVEEIGAVAVYVASGLTVNAAYHTTENGWPEHVERNGAAFPFVLGEVAIDASEKDLTPEQKEGRSLFVSACANCHSGRSEESVDTFRRTDLPSPEAPKPEPEPQVAAAPATGAASAPRRSGDCSRCHDDFDSSGNPLTRRAASEAYGPGPHDVIPKLLGLDQRQIQGRELYQAACADCHAADGTGANWVGNFLERSPTDFNAPEFAKTYERTAFVDAVLGGKKDSSMPSFAFVLSFEDADSVARYVERAFVRADGGRISGE